jgi:hypothetical protein
MAGILAALGLAGAGVAYDRAVRSDRPAPAPVGASGRSGLSFAPALIALGVVIGVSIAAELAASLWSTLLLREEAPKLAAISGVGAAFFSACQAALRFNADATGFVSATFGSSSPRFCRKRRRFRLDRSRHRTDCSVQLRARCAPVGSWTSGRARLGLAVQHADASPGAAGYRRDRPNAVAAGRVRRLCGCARRHRDRRGRIGFDAPPRPAAAQSVKARRRGGHCLGGAPIAEETRRARRFRTLLADTGRE